MTAGERSKLRGAIYGLAFGDAWGWPTEFDDFPAIARKRPDFPKPAIITDDTQMSLYVLRPVLQDLSFAHSNIKQLQQTSNEFNVNEVRIQFANSLQQWLFDPDNNRAPGNTCIHALMALEDKYLITGLEGTVEESKGNGANIRCPWLGLLRLPERTIESLAVLQASVTHNHPLALSASAVTSLLVKRIYHGEIQPGHNGLYNAAVDLTDELINQGPDSNLGENYIHGLTELATYLREMQGAVDEFHASDDLSDISAILGGGWTAEQALLSAVAVTDHYHHLPLAGLRRLAHSSGDSDSMAAIAGAFLGAFAGDGAWPVDWFAYLEPRYSQELAQVFNDLADHVFPQGSVVDPAEANPVPADVPSNLHQKIGNMFDTIQPAIGHGVNTHGVMGAGVARIIRDEYPEVYEVYRQACKANPSKLVPGGMLPVQGANGTWVLNLASQNRPGADARLDWLTTSLHAAFTFCATEGLTGFAIPRIGAGIGGLDWPDVFKVIEQAAAAHPSIEIEVWSLPETKPER